MRSFVTAACSSVLMLAAAAHAAPVISEFMASNQNGLKDEDGTRPDWLEIHNPDATPVDLGGWYLTDSASNKTKWRFPATVIPADGYLVVFASDKNRAVSGQPLHTNFALSAGGEYLGLIKPDGSTVASEYAPSFPQQYADISYGIPSTLTATTLVAENAPCQWIVPTSATSVASNWKDINFNASSWNQGTQGIGYDRDTNGTDYTQNIGTNGNTDAAMTSANNPSAYLRIPFTVAAGTTVTSLKLRVRYDDGFAVYLNGQPVTQNGSQVTRFASLPLVWNSGASGTRDDASSATYEEIVISENIPSLVAGTNVLSFQAMNRAANTTDFLLQATLEAQTQTSSGTAAAPGYFATPTPGAVNPGPEGLVIPQAVTFSKSSGTFSTNFNLTLGGAAAGQQIFYTTDGSVPTNASTLYTSSTPPLIGNSVLFRARLYDPVAGRYGFTTSAQFEKLANSINSYNGTGAPFQSALPVVILDNSGRGEIGDAEQDTRMLIYDRGTSGYASIAPGTTPSLAVNVGIKIRGRSSAGFPKKSYGVEIHDETGNGIDVSVLGMPAGEDWALIGCYNYDRAFMRNGWIYEASRQQGIWAPRTRLVEVFFNQDGNSLSYGNADYRGVYILCENIRRDKNRVDVAKISPSDVTQPNVSGGYIFKIDSSDPDEFTWKTNRNQPPSGTGGDQLVIHRPKLPDLPTQQSSYLVNYFQGFEDALYGDSATGFTTRNYRKWIDASTWIDHNIFCSYTKNVDALRLSAYFNKDRGQRIAAGPLWDFDRSVNSTDGRDANPTSWDEPGDQTHYFTFTWWGLLFSDIEFRQMYVDHWQAMRKGTLSPANVSAILNKFLAEFKPSDSDNPAKRDYARWYGSATSNDITQETNRMLSFLNTRGTWIDNQFTTQPTISRAGGQIGHGLTATLTIPSATTVYYTTDGSDPRAEGGGVSSTATAYTSGATIPLSATMKLTARALRPGTNFTMPATAWSGPVSEVYLVDETPALAADIRISGINYHPLAPNAVENAAIPGLAAYDFEWIELQNVSSTPVNLQNLSFVKGAPVFAFTLPAYTLAPGAKTLVVKNLAAFTLRYGATAAAKVVAAWPGYDSLDDDGEQITLLDATGGTIANFKYSDTDPWPSRADGLGSALVYTGTGNATTDYENGSNWKSSDAVGGSPASDPVAKSTVVVNELYSSPVSPALDAIELYNTGTSAVNIGGWYLSNALAPTTANDYRQYRIPNDTSIPAGGYLVIDQSQFNPNGSNGNAADWEFSLDGNRGGTLWLISADQASSALRNFEQKIDYTPVIPAVAYGRSPNGTGSFAPLAVYTPGAPNSDPRIGTVQVTEIQYQPASGKMEFIEIANLGKTTESLKNWALRGDVDYYFGAGFNLAPGESFVLVPFDPADGTQAAAFRSQYGVAEGVHLVGPWSAGKTLGDTKGSASLRRLVPPPANDVNYIGLMYEDDVNYKSTSPWPTGALGTGLSIRRVGTHTLPSEGTSWTSGTPTPGTGINGYAAWAFSHFGSSGQSGVTADADGDGISNLLEYLMGTDPASPNGLASEVGLVNGEECFILHYNRRTDADDATLQAIQSLDLGTWAPAEHDEVISTADGIEQRRAWLPLQSAGFLRLSGAEKN